MKILAVFVHPPAGMDGVNISTKYLGITIKIGEGI